MIWPQTRQKPEALPDVRLEGSRVFLRPPCAEDWGEWAQMRGRNRSFLKAYEPTWPDDCLTLAFFERRLVRQAQDWRTGSGHSFLLFLREEGILAGGININNVCRGAAQYATLGYWLDEAAQGHGYMTEALRLVIDYGFDTLRLHRFNAGCIPGNERSVALLARLGFTEEGFAEKYVQIDGRWQDHRLFGLPIENRKVSGSGSPPR